MRCLNVRQDTDEQINRWKDRQTDKQRISSYKFHQAVNSLCETMSIHFVEKRVLYTFRSSEFLDKLKNWLTSGRGLVVATCIKAVLYGNLKQTNSFLSKYGLAYITPGWSGSAELSPKMNLFTWAHFGKTFVACYYYHTGEVMHQFDTVYV